MNFKDELKTAFLAVNNLFRDYHKLGWFYHLRIQSTFSSPADDAIVLIKAIRQYFSQYGHNKVILSASYSRDDFLDLIVATADGSILVNNHPYHLKRWCEYQRLNDYLKQLFNADNIIAGVKYLGTPVETSVKYKLNNMKYIKSLFYWVTDYNNHAFIEYVESLAEYQHSRSLDEV